MARRNHLRSLLAASLLMVGSSAVGMLAAPSPASAHHLNFVPDYRVTVYEDSFNPNVVYAKPGQTVQFELAAGVSNRHTVTLDNGKCEGRPQQLCEETFEDPDHPPVFRFSNYGEYPYHDRYAKDAGLDMSGKIVITDNPPTVQPPNPPPTTTTSTPSTTVSSTSTTRPATTTTLAPTTTTTAPATIRPFLIGSGGSSTTTTAAPAAAAPKAGPAEASPADSKSKDKGKGKNDGKGKTPATDPTVAAASEGSPIEVLFDASTLTPLPEASPTADGPTTSDSGPEEAALLDLLGADSPADDGTRILLIAGGLLAFAVLLVAATAWFRRSSRYFPA